MDADLKQYLDEMQKAINQGFADVRQEVSGIKQEVAEFKQKTREEFDDLIFAIDKITKEMATKSDIARLDAKIDRVHIELDMKIDRVHTELKEEISGFKKRIDDEVLPEVDAVKKAYKLNYELESETRARVAKPESFNKGIKEAALAQ
jgi:predicted  nucleic acid-binding Zn-ribbon protein